MRSGHRGRGRSQRKTEQPANPQWGQERKTPPGRSTYQSEVVLQHLKRNHRRVGHTTEAALLRP